MIRDYKQLSRRSVITKTYILGEQDTLPAEAVLWVGSCKDSLCYLVVTREEELFLNSPEDNIHAQRPGISCKSKCPLAPVPFVGAGVVGDELSF